MTLKSDEERTWFDHGMFLRQIAMNDCLIDGVSRASLLCGLRRTG